MLGESISISSPLEFSSRGGERQGGKTRKIFEEGEYFAVEEKEDREVKGGKYFFGGAEEEWRRNKTPGNLCRTD